MKNKIVKLLSLFFVFVQIILYVTPCVAENIRAAEDETFAFIKELLTGGNIELPYDVRNDVYENISAATGYDDEYKTYIVTGMPDGTYTSGVQYFQNGKYENGVFNIDYGALSEYVIKSINVYETVETTLSQDENSRARAIVAYAFEKLPLMNRISVENAPKWLIGGYYEGLSVLDYAENCLTSSKPASSVVCLSPDDAEGSEGFARKIRNDTQIYFHGLLFDMNRTRETEFEVPEDARYFIATLSSDATSLQTEYKNAKMKVFVRDVDGIESEYGIYCVYRGYENKIEIELRNAESVRLVFECDAQSQRVNCILADALFIGTDSNKTSVDAGHCNESKLGDVNRDGLINSFDITALERAVVGDGTLSLFSRDTNMDLEVDYSDCLCLENYLIYVKNMNSEFNNLNEKLYVVALGDSIARGYGLDGSDNEEPSEFSYGALIASELDKATSYDADFVNYGNDGDKVADLINKIVSDGDIKNSLEKADLIVVSIGGNDFLSALKDAFVSHFDKDLDDIENALKEIADADYTDLLNYLSGNEIDSALKDLSKQYAENIKALIAQLKQTSDNAHIMFTTVPNTAVDSDFVYRLNLPLIGEQDVQICNLYRMFDEWLKHFNEELVKAAAASENEKVTVVDTSKMFDGAPELSFLEISEKVYLNDLAKGDFSDIRKLDIHPSALGHEIIAEAHLEKLADKIVQWENEYEGTVAHKDAYKYSQSISDQTLKVNTDVGIGEDKQILSYTVIENADQLENLLVSVNFDNEKLNLTNVKYGTEHDLLYGFSDGVFKLLVTKNQILPEKFTLTLTFEKTAENTENTMLAVNAAESRVTVNGEYKRYGANDTEIDFEKIENDAGKENVPKPIVTDDTSVGDIIVPIAFLIATVIVIISVIAAVAMKKKK